MNSSSLPHTTKCMFFADVDLDTLFASDSLWYVSKVVVVINSISSPLSAIGNGLILAVIITTCSLHTPANLFIGSLAIADILIGAVVQPMFTAIVTVKDLFHNCSHRDSLLFLGITCTSASVALMAAVSCERYIALFLHLRYSTMVTNTRVWTVVVLIWIISVIIALLASFGFALSILSQVLLAFVWVVSLLATGFSYFNIVVLVRHHRRQIQSQHTAVSTSNETASQTKLAITMGYVIGLSFLLFVPTAITYQIFVTIKSTSSLVFDTFIVTMATQFTSSSLNPVFYCWRRQDIRQATIAMFRKVRCLKRT